jgi:hypothetical protein
VRRESAVREADGFHEVGIDLLGEAVESPKESCTTPGLRSRDLLKGGVVSLRQGVDLIAADGVHRGAEARNDLASHVFELADDDDGLLEGPGALVSREQALPEIFGLAMRTWAWR